MKIVSVLIFATALIGSWYVVHAKRPIAQSVHAGIQADLKNIIAEYVQKNLPESRGLRFEKFWTETVQKNKVKAYFVYSFEDTTEGGEPASVEIEGSAILNKIDENEEVVTWSFDELQILDNKVEFSEPIQVTAGTGELEGSSAPPLHGSEGESEKSEQPK